MTTLAFTSLYDEVLSELVGITQPMALNSIRNSAIEFCERSKVWTEDIVPMDSVAAQTPYTFVSPVTDTDVIGVKQAWYNGIEIFPKTAAQLGDLLSDVGSTFVSAIPWKNQTGVPKYYLIERPDQFRLAPYPDAVLAAAIEMNVILRPTRSATGMEKWVLDKYFMQIAAGCKSKLCAMPNKPWSSPELVSYYTAIYEAGISTASVATSGTHVLPEMVTAPSPI